ncbi:uncharacterized protein si:dkey-225f5.4 isoform X2 [Boleophthalmus pectinirostris]|nr:uncharacterized protein si:dkey-225f5.4 isoform X2 [Boleophthalmus pectinirostris]XP_055008455.1 uncharacterized protein si:dkey-225f5.4 isoform X2 [Boleophthalmus pectinirostris]XP_055008456.1 uncharacterized protein si:dkey-225f5.4 isoform X2 [Boleophthalmus pectinirostris]XP_055008457.1 uncharacterized protein si:dkey-225f5.4 isoform X2 [Boleophthalmus pectinirostris]XP_055008458.1 uncharacterized protein si:dkey-225f5.4 isoform X2 [Boleophthalmus pectinirostris]
MRALIERRWFENRKWPPPESERCCRAVIRRCWTSAGTWTRPMPPGWCSSSRRRVQKVLWRQLFVLDSMVSLMEELKSARQLLTTPCPAPPEFGARGRWKDLKLRYKSSVEETEKLLQTQIQKIQQIDERRERVTQLLHTLHTQGAQQEALQASLLSAHDALRQSEVELRRLLAEAEVTAGHMIDWERIRDDLQVEVSLVQDVMKMKLVSLSPSELSLEIIPDPGLDPGPPLEPGLDPGLDPGPGLDSEPLRLTVKFGPDDTFTLQVSEVWGLEDGSSGSRFDLRSVLLELLQKFRGQSELLSEIQTLRHSFAIDWRPSLRRLVFLKSAAVVCELQVEDGYPRRGGVTLLSVQREGARRDITDVQNQEKKLSLTQWLLLLSSSPQV